MSKDETEALWVRYENGDMQAGYLLALERARIAKPVPDWACSASE